MVKHTIALERLTKERDYEDRLVHTIFHFCLDCLPHIEDMTAKEKRLVKDTLTTISEDSERHSFLFDQLIQMLWEDEKGDY